MADYSFSYRTDTAGRTHEATDGEHIRDLIEQILLTAPGERVNRPDFGAGLLQLVFDPNSTELAAALEFTVQSALERWLGDRIQLRALKVRAVDSTIRVVVQYQIRGTQDIRTDEFVREA